MKNFAQFVLTVIVAITMVSCSNSGEVKSIKAKVLKHKYFPHLASASGVEFVNGEIYIVGDDSPFLFQLDESWNIVSKQKISGID